MAKVLKEVASNFTPLVLVSGVSGYIGSWTAYVLLKLGYRVRGTVRSLKNEKKVAFLRDLCPGSDHKLELVEADLSSDEGWDKAVEGCTYILHVASPFPAESPSDKYELIKPAVDGTLRVLKAAANTENKPKRVIVTSSVVAIAYGHSSSELKPFTEEDWSVADDPSNPIKPYEESKLLAEKAAWDFLSKFPENEKPFELACVNPGLVQGPMLSSNGCTSAEIVSNVLTGKLPAIPDIDIPICHVFDVVKAHVAAMTHPEAAGKRFLVSSGVISFIELGKIIQEEFSSKGFTPTTFVAPYWLLWVLSFIDAKAKDILPSVGKRMYLDPKNVKNVLKMDIHTNIKDIILEMAYSAINEDVVPMKPGKIIQIPAYTRPEPDLTQLEKAQPSVFK